jgi:trehalose/maltose hydrolase-like predicted phosphorylase
VAAEQLEIPDWDRLTEKLDDLVAAGFDRLLADHREAWAKRWANARVDIEGCPGDELAARFAVFHLLGSALDEGEVAVGARGLSGPDYAGHVFWDADVFTLPALAAIRPAAARAMLEYRIRRLPAARRAAQELGLAGARIPWESAATGRDVTPREVSGPDGEVIRIRTGELEEHVVADVAWAAQEYASWTGESEFLRGPGADLLLDTARYWASRVTIEGDGRGHVRGVIGPDEYHEDVDDNAYTNVMARWNLLRAADLADDLGIASEAARWRQIAGKLVDGWDPSRRLYEQFAGYWSLEPLLVDDVAAPPFAADVLLGGVRARGSQLIKQADVLMLHHLVPDEVEPDSLRTNLSFYDARTTHGSSLSPAIHAALLARCGEPDRALVPFRIAARLDLDDLTGTTSGGLHLATMGGLWQALAYGFCGLRPGADQLVIDPQLPSDWSALTLNLLFHGVPVRVRAEHERVVVDCTAPLTVRIGAGPPRSCRPPGRTFATPA